METNFYIEKNFDRLSEVFNENEITNKKVLFIIDNAIVSKYYNDIEASLSQNNNINIYTYKVVSGEKAKNIKCALEIYEYMISKNFSRNDVVVSIGGGAISDLAGFVASTYMRGIDFAIIPTTILSMVDASIGGKNSININDIKNVVGTFKEPLFIYVNTYTVNSQKEREYTSGLVEAIKMALISDSVFFKYFEKNKEKIRNRDNDALLYIIKKSYEIKQKYVSADMYDNGIRKYLNFGHTFGHAIETTEHFKLLHGECVAIGIKIAMEMSEFKESERVLKLFEYLGIDTNYLIKNHNALINIIRRDKKCKNGKLDFIYLDEIGKAFIKELSV